MLNFLKRDMEGLSFGQFSSLGEEGILSMEAFRFVRYYKKAMK
jgi:hypothetical protein